MAKVAFKQCDIERAFKAAAALRGMEPNQLFVEVWDHYERTCPNEPHARTRR